MAAQDQCLPTHAYKAKINKDGSNPACHFDETVGHIVRTGHPDTEKEYVIRYDRVG